MLKHLSGDKWLGLLASIAAVLLMFVWVPLDVDTGLVEKVRRQVNIGDSLGPIFAGFIILIGGLMCLLRPDASAPTLTHDNLNWAARLILLVALGLLIMRFVGPALVDLVAEPSYRSLRATPPWNYVGYVLGGTFLVAALISAVRGQIRVSAVLIGLVASLAIALLYDLPFDDLQLPPNGDV